MTPPRTVRSAAIVAAALVIPVAAATFDRIPRIMAEMRERPLPAGADTTSWRY